MNTTLFSMGSDGFSASVNGKIWMAIDEIVLVKECDIYSFVPDPEMEPDSDEGNL